MIMQHCSGRKKDLDFWGQLLLLLASPLTLLIDWTRKNTMENAMGIVPTVYLITAIVTVAGIMVTVICTVVNLEETVAAVWIKKYFKKRKVQHRCCTVQRTVGLFCKDIKLLMFTHRNNQYWSVPDRAMWPASSGAAKTYMSMKHRKAALEDISIAGSFHSCQDL